MPHRRYRPTLLLPALIALIAALASPASAAPDSSAAPDPDAAVAYQIGGSHDGYFPDSTVAPPLTSRWSDTFAGAVSYPLIADRKAFGTVASSGGSSGTTLYALSQATGATVWSQPISGTYHLSNAAYDSGQVFVVNFDGLLRAFDADTGTLNWSMQLAGGQYAFNSPPTAAGGNVYVTGSGYGSTLYAVSETSGAMLWSQEIGNADNSSPALSGKSVFVSDPRSGFPIGWWIHDPPISTGRPARSIVCSRPPTRLRASSTTHATPACASALATVNPAIPAPTTTTRSTGPVTKPGTSDRPPSYVPSISTATTAPRLPRQQ